MREIRPSGSMRGATACLYSTTPNREALGLVSGYEQRKRLPPKPPINAKIMGVGCHDRMRSIQFRESNEASVRIVHLLAITREYCAYRC